MKFVAPKVRAAFAHSLCKRIQFSSFFTTRRRRRRAAQAHTARCSLGQRFTPRKTQTHARLHASFMRSRERHWRRLCLCTIWLRFAYMLLREQRSALNNYNGAPTAAMRTGALLLQRRHEWRCRLSGILHNSRIFFGALFSRAATRPAVVGGKQITRSLANNLPRSFSRTDTHERFIQRVGF